MTALLSPNLLVAEVGTGLAVRACGSLLADLGADVVRMSTADFMTGDAVDPVWAKADVVLLASDASPQERKLWLRESPAHQIVIDITAFGHTGPMAQQPASEAELQALTGIVDTTGWADGPPLVVGFPVVAMMTAAYATASVLIAIIARTRTGAGQKIDLAQYDVAISSLTNFIALDQAGISATRSGNRHPLWAPWSTYRATDGYVQICTATDEHWQKLCKLFEAPEHATSDQFRHDSARRQNANVVDALVQGWVGEFSAHEVTERLGSVGIACGPVTELAAVSHDVNLLHRKSVAPEGGCSPLKVQSVQAGIAPIERARHTQDKSNVRPLQHIRVIEVGQYTVAPLVGRQLGAFGADVVKVESPGGDGMRSASPFNADGDSYVFAIANTDKRGVVIDLSTAAGRAQLGEMLAEADVLVENLKPGSLSKLGFSATSLRAKYPRLIYCPVTGFGHDSAYPGRAALDTVLQAMTGMMSVTTWQDVPTKAGISAVDLVAGQVGLVAVLAGLEHRERTGCVAHFDVTMHEAAAWMTLRVAAELDDKPKPAVIECADGYVVVEPNPDGGVRVAGERALSRDDVIASMRAAGVRATPVHSIVEVLQDPQLHARGMLVDATTQAGVVWRVLNSPMALQLTPPLVNRVIGQLGEDERLACAAAEQPVRAL
jgi:crotonobetainyl-CoA:carnitine CoA-transferase CaiB-like acyl-CoA transferase